MQKAVLTGCFFVLEKRFFYFFIKWRLQDAAITLGTYTMKTLHKL